jgi:hypothetical protein
MPLKFEPIEIPFSFSNTFNNKIVFQDLLKTIHTITNCIYYIVHIKKMEWEDINDYDKYYHFIIFHEDKYKKLPKNKETKRFYKLTYLIWNEIIRNDWEMDETEFLFYYDLYLKQYSNENKFIKKEF